MEFDSGVDPTFSDAQNSKTEFLSNLTHMSHLIFANVCTFLTQWFNKEEG